VKKGSPFRTAALRAVPPDFLTVEMPEFDPCISNIPYNIFKRDCFQIAPASDFPSRSVDGSKGVYGQNDRPALQRRLVTIQPRENQPDERWGSERI
jgi:hypothetical protein